MIDDRKLSITMYPVHYEEELSHWEATMEFDGEQVYTETGLDLRDVSNKIYQHVWEDDSIIPNTYRYKMLDNPFTPNVLRAMEIKENRNSEQ
jgi:hypothetical protein